MRKSIFILCSLFIITIGLRSINFNRSLSKHHEFNAAMILIPMDIWETSSPSNFYYAPVMTYQNEGDKKINNMTFEYMQKDGNYYYLSFPLLTYILPYLFFKSLGLPIVPFSLQLFNILLHFISVILLFKIMVKMCLKRIGTKNANNAGLIAGIVFLFSPATLWFFGNGYTHHVLVIPFILWATLIWLNLIIERKKSNQQLLSLSLALFLAGITAWIGCLFALIITIVEIYRWWRTKRLNHLIWLPISSILCAIGIMFWHYTQIVGYNTFLLYLENRFLTRSIANNEFKSILNTLISLGKWYVIGYSLWFILLLAAIIVSIKNKFSFSKVETTIVSTLILLAFSHHLLLQEFTQVHDYSVLIDSLFIAIIIGICIESWRKKATNIIIYGILSLCILTSIIQYYYINRPGEISQNGDTYNAMKNIGELIKKEANPNELVFTVNLNERPAPQVMYYAKRNFIQATNMDKVNTLFNERKKKLGIVFFIKEMKVVKIQRIKKDI